MPFNNKNAYLNPQATDEVPSVGADPGPPRAFTDFRSPGGGGNPGADPGLKAFDDRGANAGGSAGTDPGNIFGARGSVGTDPGPGANDPLNALRAWLSSQGGAYRPDRPDARRLLRGLVGSEDSKMPIDLALRQQLLSPFIDKIRASRKEGVGSVAFLLNLLGYGAGQPPGGFGGYRR